LAPAPETTVAPTTVPETTTTLPPIEYVTTEGIKIDCSADFIPIVENLFYDRIWETCPDPITSDELNRLNFTITDKSCIPINYLVRLVETAEQQYVTEPCPTPVTQPPRTNTNSSDSSPSGGGSSSGSSSFEIYKQKCASAGGKLGNSPIGTFSEYLVSLGATSAEAAAFGNRNTTLKNGWSIFGANNYCLLNISF